MKEFAFALSIKCENTDERDKCLKLFESIGYKNAYDYSDSSRNVITNYGRESSLITAHSGDSLNYYNDRHHIDHFNPELIRDIAAACTNKFFQKDELSWCVNDEKIGYGRCSASDQTPINSYYRRPTLDEICNHHGYEVKGRNIVKKQDFNVYVTPSTVEDFARLAVQVLRGKDLQRLANIIDQNSNDKLYKVTMNADSEGKMFTNRLNMGFDSYTLLGMLNSVSADVMEQIKGNNTPDVVQKTVITKN